MTPRFPARRATALALMTTTALMAGTAAQATVTVFDDRTDFLAATLETTTETFDGYVKDTAFHSAAYDVGAFTLSMTPGASNAYNFIDAPPLLTSATDLNGTAHLMVFTDTGIDLTIAFDQPISAFGADFKGINDEFERTRFSVDGVDVAIPGEPVNLQLTFFGFTRDTPFSTLTFHGVRNDIYGIDNLSFGTAVRVPAVPEPGSVLLMALGLGAMGVARRRVGAER